MRDDTEYADGQYDFDTPSPLASPDILGGLALWRVFALVGAFLVTGGILGAVITIANNRLAGEVERIAGR